MTQKQKILSLLSDGRWHSNGEMITVLKMSSYSQRIGDLKKEGYDIRRTHDKHNSAHHFWRLFKDYVQAELPGVVNISSTH